MDSQKTTHILLTIIAVGIFFMIFLFMKERYFTRTEIEPVVWEETIPAKPWTTQNPPTNPVKPTPAPNSTPVPTPVTQQNVSLVAEQNYKTSFGFQNTVSYKFCGERSLVTDDVSPVPYYYFLPTAYSCSDMEPGGQTVLYMSTTMFRATLKATTTEAQINALEENYGVTNTAKRDNRYTFMLGGHDNPYNSYSMTKIFFDSGLFISTEMIDIRFP